MLRRASSRVGWTCPVVAASTIFKQAMPQTWLAQRAYSATSRAPEARQEGSSSSRSSLRMMAPARWADSHWQKYGTARRSADRDTSMNRSGKK
ncbi:hypothetical protein WJ967_11515 [Achromobacter xylosoxidans]